jgi:hypothetical protein
MNYSKKDAITDNLKCWAKTEWGGRPMNFFFGLNAQSQIFEQQDLAKEKLKEQGQAQLKKYFGFLNIQKFEIITSDANTVQIYLKASFVDEPKDVIEIRENIGV